MAEDLVLHYQGVNRLLGSPAPLNRALAVAIGALLSGSAARLLSGGRALDENRSPAEVAKRFPGSVHRVTLAGGSVLAHPVRTPLIAMGVTFLAVVLLGFLLFARFK